MHFVLHRDLVDHEQEVIFDGVEVASVELSLLLEPLELIELVDNPSDQESECLDLSDELVGEVDVSDVLLFVLSGIHVLVLRINGRTAVG